MSTCLFFVIRVNVIDATHLASEYEPDHNEFKDDTNGFKIITSSF